MGSIPSTAWPPRDDADNGPVGVACKQTAATVWDGVLLGIVTGPDDGAQRWIIRL
jgi:hypothetical protein